MPETKAEDLGRNDPCHCGSGKKYKRCCLAKDEAAEREARAEAAAAAVKTKPKQKADDAPRPKQKTEQPWKRESHHDLSFQRFKTPRKSG